MTNFYLQSEEFKQNLRDYARLAVEVGVAVKEGQRLLIQSPVEAAALTRELVRAAYRAGASFVDVRWDDDDVVLARFELAKGGFDQISRWRVDAEMEVAEAGGAVLSVRATNPGLLKDVPAERVTEHQRAVAAYRKPYMNKVMTNSLNWNLISAPVGGWAALMFPEASSEEAIEKQWKAIFAAVRVGSGDPVAAWKEHLAALHRRKKVLTERQFAALHFRSEESGTDLTLGLAKGHIWGGGAATAGTGAEFTANIPTEEVWTAPNRGHADGVVFSTKPLSHNGVVIDGIRVRFEGGKVAEASAQQGEEVLKTLLDTDEGARHLGEVALVPHSSPISKSGLFFFNTLYDENASSHIALGSAYRFNVEGGVESDEAFKAAGGNDSLIHVDWMIGTADMTVQGIAEDGTREDIMVGGEFKGDFA